MTTATAVALPDTFGDNTLARDIRLTVTADANLGGFFSLLEDLANSGSYDPSWTDPAMPTFDQRAWSLKFETLDGTAIEVGPSHLGAANFDSFAHYSLSSVPSGFVAADSRLSVWKGVRVPGTSPLGIEEDDDYVTVQLASLTPSDTGDDVQFFIWVTREYGRRSRLMTAIYPYLVMKGIAGTVGGDLTHEESQWRCRVLTDLPLLDVSPRWFGTNMPLHYIAGADVKATQSTYDLVRGSLAFRHPSTAQRLPFMSMTDQAALASKGNTVMLVADDSKNQKMFYGEATTNATDECGILFGHGAIPTLTEEMIDNLRSLDTFPPQARFGNSLAPQYATRLRVFKTASVSSFFHEICAKYRTQFEATYSPTWIKDNTRLTPAAKDPNCVLTFIHFDKNPTQQYLDDVLATVQRFKRLLDNRANPGATPVSISVHFQTYLKDQGAAVGGPPPGPITDFALKGFPDLVKSLIALGRVHVSCYANPNFLEEGWERNYQDTGKFLAGDRSDQLNDAPPSPDTFRQIDQGVERTRQRTMSANVYGLLSKMQGDSAYIDTYSGTSRLPEVAMIDGVRAHPGLGGKVWTEGKSKGVDELRAEMDGGSFNDGFLFSEHGDEGFFAFGDLAIDWWQDGYTNISDHYNQSESAALFDSLDTPKTDYDLRSRNLNPPLWNIVHHAWAPSRRLDVSSVRNELATYSETVETTGMSANEALDKFCWAKALCFIGGFGPYNEAMAMRDHKPAFEVDEIGRTSVPSSSDDPGSIGLTEATFIQDLITVYADDFALTFMQGKIAIPPVILSVAASSNPAFAVTKVNGQQDKIVPTPGAVLAGYQPENSGVFVYGSFVAGRRGYLTFNVDNVFQQMFQVQNGDVALVMVNWTRSVQVFHLTFDPTDYGLGSPYNVHTLSPGGGANLEGPFSGSITIENDNGGETLDLLLTSIPAHSVRVLRFQPVPE